MPASPTNVIVVRAPRVEGCKIIAEFGADELWVSARNKSGDLHLKPNIETFLPMWILLASQRGCDIEIAAPIEDGYFCSLDLGLSPFVAALYGGHRPKLYRREVNTASTHTRPGRSALMFSGGVDSFYSLRRLLDANVHLDYFINIHAGAHDNNRQTWDARLKNVSAVSDELALSTIEIDTNFHILYPDAHVRCATIRNLSACLSLFPEVDTFYYSTAIAYEDISFRTAREHGIHFIDYAAAANLLPIGVRAIEIGYEASRAQKTALVSQYALSYSHLDVCTDQTYQAQGPGNTPLNCGRCLKCIRTIATLEHQGSLHRYAGLFSLDAWQSHRTQALDMLKSSHEPLDQDVIKFFEARSTRN